MNNSDRMKNNLLTIYESLHKRAQKVPHDVAKNMGLPLLPFPRDRWFHSSNRLLIIGQETFEWYCNSEKFPDWPHCTLSNFIDFRNYDKSIEALTYAYMFDYYVDKSNYPNLPKYRTTPFTRVMSIFSDIFNRSGDGDLLTSNLFKTIYRTTLSRSPLKATTQELEVIMDWQKDCLVNEIKILQPTSVIFFTGPNYEHVLMKEFPETTVMPIDNYLPNRFARLVHKDLPAKTFRTYHPAYLMRSRKWDWVEKLIELSITD